jgi:CRP-like cAMP-binding protein
VRDRSDLLTSNAILASLPAEELSRMQPHLEIVEVGTKTMVYDRMRPIECVYFPVNAVFSFVATVDDEVVVEVGTIGKEGMVGLPAFLGSSVSPDSAFSQVAGLAACMEVTDFHAVLRSDGHLHDRLLRYTQAFIVQVAQNTACNRIHTTEERAARWLLTTADRVGAEEFVLTQQFLAQMLGVRRPTVSLTAGILQAAGLITYTRGRVRIVDREQLEQSACDCYAIVRDEFARFLSETSA